MHRRTRHFNSRDAGAVLSVDSRYIVGLSDNDGVGTWTDRTRNGNNLTQNTAALKPTYQVGEQGGCPVVRYIRTIVNADMQTLSFTTAITTLRSFVAFVKQDGLNGNFAPAILGHSSAYDFAGAPGNSNTGYLYSITYAAAAVLNGTTRRNGVTYNNNTTMADIPSIISLVTTGNVSASRLSKDRSFNSWWGDIGHMSIFTTALTDPLKKRLEHATAYSFKIACS